jgi:hypothetical protein
MHKMLGPDLAAWTRWVAVDDPIPDGPLAAIYAESEGIHKWAHYLPIYETAFAPYKDRPIRMLEIGVSKGGSLKMWRQYLHPDSVIVGIDIDPACAQYDDPDYGIHVRIGGQQDVPFLQSIVDEVGRFDIIVDDGSHLSSHIIDTFKFLFPNALADGGLYLVEDLHANYWQPYRDISTTFADFAGWLTHAMHAHYARYRAEVNYRTGGPKRPREYKVPLATTIIDRVESRDSITIVYRRQRTPPRSIYK